MSDLIDRKAAIEALRRAEALTRAFGYHNVIETIRLLPSADIDLSDYSDRLWRKAYEQGKADAESERKTGKWIDYPIVDGCLQCSVCGILRFDEANYCPNCGAKMEKEEE